MNFFLNCILFFAFLLSTSIVFSQEKIGVITDGFLPVNQVSNNPAAIVDQKPWISFNLVGAHFFARTNFMYISDARLKLRESEYLLALDAPNKNGRAFLSFEILGPSITMSSGKNGFGFHTAVRSYANLNRIPGALGQILADQQVDSAADGTYQINNGRIKSMTWAEYGISYGRILLTKGRQIMSTAITVNRIIGIHQANLLVKNAEAVVKNGNGTLTNLDGKYSFTDVGWGGGKGWGLNGGFVFKKMAYKSNMDNYYSHSRKGGCRTSKYDYKIGISILDVGYIRFRENSQSATLSDTAKVTDIEKGISDVIDIEQSKFTAYLPTALSIQVDYRIQDFFYANATLIQKVSFANVYGVERSNVLSISPRFESPWFSASLPLSLSNYTVPQVGLYLRLGYLAIGTDHISPFIIKSDIKAADFYVYLNIPIQKSPACREKREAGRPKLLCPAWR